jgi:uncharacterized membrane protein
MTKKRLSLRELFKNAWEVYRKNIGMFLLIIILGMLLVSVFLVPGFLAVFVALHGSFNSSGQITFNTFSIVGIIIFFTTIILGIVASIVYSGALIKAVSLAEAGQKIKIGEVFGLAYHKFWQLLGTSLLGALFIFLGLILLIIPGLALAIYFQFMLYIVIFENKSGFEALKRSYEIVKGHFWWVVLILLIVGIIQGLIGSIPYVNSILMFFILPFTQIIIYLIYRDLKGIKKEG